MGFKKSTVYKVYETFQSYSGAVTKPVWTIENIRLDRGVDGRYLPGDKINVSFFFKNNADRDLYVVNIGIQTEWMIKEGIWHCQTLKDVIKAGQRRHFSLSFDVPNDIPLGEYEMMFGVEGQYLPVQGYQDQMLSTQWSEPQILDIKKPLTGTTVFISHSVADRHRVAVLDKTLDNYGVRCLIGEDEIRPGVNLESKFKNMIDSCNILIALMTDTAARSPWVLMEVNYALKQRKRCILLKEESVQLDTDIEWINFSRNESDESIVTKVMSAINNIIHENNATTGALLVGLLAALVGVGLASRR